MEGETGPQLVIPALTQGDVANYACNASNTAGYEYKVKYIYLESRPM